MRIGIDIAQLADRNLTGIPMYIESLVREYLREAGPEQFVLVGNHQGRVFPEILERRALCLCRSGAELVPGWDLRLAPRFPALARPPLGWATRKLDGRVLLPLGNRWTNRDVRPVDIFHHTSWLRIAAHRARRHVVTLYDLTTRFYPEVHPPANIVNWESAFAFARDRADAVITISESARRDIIEHLGIEADRVHVIPLAVRPTLPRDLEPEAVAEVRAKFGLNEGRYVLAAGSLDPRKNLPRLIKAFAALAREPGMGDVRLALAGGRAHGTEAALGAIERHGLSARVTVTGYVSDTEMAALMKGCDLFAYPSLYEGFGLPVLEAMAMGAPVVTSNVSSLPEVAGDAALLVDPLCTESIADALYRGLTDDTLAADLRRRGSLRAGAFSWERTAREHRDLYRQVGG